MRTLMCHAAILLLLQLVGAVSVVAGEVVKVRIFDLAFFPVEISARVGDIIEWANGDFIDHTATANNEDWDVMIPASTSAQLKLTRAGTIDYFCRFHPSMTGTIHVTAD